MSFEAVQLVGGALGGALASSVLGPLISQRRERRDVRADVLRAFSVVERTRWAPLEWDDFRAALTELRSAALVAGVDRRVVEPYLRLAQVARANSEDSWERHHDEEVGSFISSKLGDLLRESAELLTDVAWHPYRTRGRTRSKLEKLHTAEAVLESDEDESDIRWSLGYF
jgi:hypothetical protein